MFNIIIIITTTYKQYWEAYIPNCEGGYLWEVEWAWGKGWTRAGTFLFLISFIDFFF